MQKRQARRVMSRLHVSVVLLLAVGFLAVARPGVAQNASNECLAQFVDVPAGDENGGTIMCNDCDPACDQDGVNTPNQACTFTSAFIGSLPIPLALTTGTQTQTSADLSAQQFVFCGFCGQQFSPSFQNPPHACTADSQCTTGSFTRCRQRTSGAFGQGPARTISETGVPAACLTDGMPHASILSGVFCVPPSYNATVDAAGDLPGPGAIALIGEAQAVP